MPYFNRGIPQEAHDTMGQFAAAGIAVFAVTHGGGWVLIARDGRYFARGIPDECFQKIGEFLHGGDKVRVVAFTPDGGWVVLTDRHYFARGIPDECFQKIGEFWNKGWQITAIAFPPPGGNRWLILAGGALYARNVPAELFQWLRNYQQGTSPARFVGFPPSGGNAWAMVTPGYYAARNVPPECFQKIGEFYKDGWAVDQVVFMPTGGGWSVIANDRVPANASDPVREFEWRMFQDGGTWKSIWDRMAAYHVPGVSVAAVIDNRLAWACGYGQLEAGTDQWVLPENPFQAASVSKAVSAIGFLRLVQDNLIGLDDSVVNHVGWNLPKRACAQQAWMNAVTLHNLLPHQGGIIGVDTTDADPAGSCTSFKTGGFGGFNGYANTPGVQVPTVDQILNGTAPANSPRVELTHQPGVGTTVTNDSRNPPVPQRSSSYSGGAYVYMQRLLQNLRGTDLGTWMANNVFSQAGMTHSTYQLEPTALSPSAGHDSNGAVIPGKRNRYPESAPAGLYTTAADLCQLIIMWNQQGQVNGHAIVDATRADDMRVRGLGPQAWSQNTNDWTVWHNGANHGFKCEFYAYPSRRAGYAVFTNGDDGDKLYGEIHAALKRTYGWP
jgi:CubicO group peptidase (beta-lactamase class C family)